MKVEDTDIGMPAALSACLAEAEDRAHRLAAAALAADWPTARELDAALAETVAKLPALIATGSAADREAVAARLEAVRTVHAGAVVAVQRARDAIRTELAAFAGGKRAVASYEETRALARVDGGRFAPEESARR